MAPELHASRQVDVEELDAQRAARREIALAQALQVALEGAHGGVGVVALQAHVGVLVGGMERDDDGCGGGQRQKGKGREEDFAQTHGIPPIAMKHGATSVEQLPAPKIPARVATAGAIPFILLFAAGDAMKPATACIACFVVPAVS